MRFLVDENLPPRFAIWLCDHGHDALHAQRAGLIGRDDAAVAQYAISEQRVILTKDGDFQNVSASVVQLLIGNAPTTVLLAWIEARLPIIESQLRAGATRIVID